MGWNEPGMNALDRLRLIRSLRASSKSIGRTRHALETFGISRGTSSVRSIFSSPGIRASHSAMPEIKKETSIRPISGQKSSESFARYDPDSSCWKTSLGTSLSDSTQFSGIWPRAGTMQRGIAYRQPPLVPPTRGTVYGSLPTPTATANQLSPSMMKHSSCRRLRELVGPNGRLTPRLWEWMMGFPEGWTGKH